LNRLYEVVIKDTAYFVMNDDLANYGHDLLVFTKKKEGIFYKFEQERYINQNQNISLPEIPQRT